MVIKFSRIARGKRFTDFHRKGTKKILFTSHFKYIYNNVHTMFTSSRNCLYTYKVVIRKNQTKTDQQFTMDHCEKPYDDAAKTKDGPDMT